MNESMNRLYIDIHVVPVNWVLVQLYLYHLCLPHFSNVEASLQGVQCTVHTFLTQFDIDIEH